jgi:hypothetical protein
MTVQISLPDDLEEQLRRRAAEAGVDVETFVKNAVTDQLKAEPDLPPRRRTHEEFMRALDEIIAMHPPTGGRLDDSRESIYAGRGE